MSWSNSGGATRTASARGSQRAVAVAAMAGAAGASSGSATLRPRTQYVFRAGTSAAAAGAKHAHGDVAPEVKLEVPGFSELPLAAARARADEDPDATVAGIGASSSANSGSEGQLSAVARAGSPACREGTDNEAIACAPPVDVPYPVESSTAPAQEEVGAIGVPARAVERGVEAVAATAVAAGVVTINAPNGDGSGRDHARERPNTTNRVAVVAAAAATPAAAAASAQAAPASAAPAAPAPAGNGEAMEPASHVEGGALCEPSRDAASLQKPCYVYLQVIGPAPSEDKVPPAKRVMLVHKNALPATVSTTIRKP
ncbi:unnamed protein product, partial [Laminaria digitata]